MIKTLFLTGARVNEFVHIRVEDLYLDDESAQIYLTHAKREACRYVPVLPALAQEQRGRDNMGRADAHSPLNATASDGVPHAAAE